MNIDTIKESGDTIFLAEVLLDALTGGEINPVLWCRDGQFRLVPKEVIQNAVNLYETLRQQEVKVKIPATIILWSQGIPINNAAGRALIGE
ncbi:hypothetical protein LCGC14_0437110 [marine sediment metagenome]|uniref:Uncharacterized protein n=1 Tax=marine sediment metagenome TaxID=412755 RepID=A0A0F9SLC4_9ZZZZ